MPPRRVVRIGPGCQALRLPTGWWHVRFYDKSQTPREKQHGLDTDDEAIALTRARERYERRLAGLYDPWKGAGRDLSLTAAAALYVRARSPHLRERSTRHVAGVLGTFAKQLGRRAGSLRAIRPADVEAFVYRPALAQASQRSYWRALNVFFSWAADAGHVDASIVAAVPPPRLPAGAPRYYTEAQHARLLDAAERHHADNEHVHRREAYELWARDAIEFLAWTGLRRGEAARLRWRHVSMPEDHRAGVGLIHVESGDRRKESKARGAEGRTKSGKDRHVTMIPPAESLLRRLAENRRSEDPDEHVLKGPDGQRAIAPEYLSRRLRVYRDLAELPAVPLHGLRHSFAARMRERGADLMQIRDELGHADIATTSRYAEIHPIERATRTAALFADLRAGVPNPSRN